VDERMKHLKPCSRREFMLLILPMVQITVWIWLPRYSGECSENLRQRDLTMSLLTKLTQPYWKPERHHYSAPSMDSTGYATFAEVAKTDVENTVF
jgi:hypothetical protein